MPPWPGAASRFTKARDARCHAPAYRVKSGTEGPSGGTWYFRLLTLRPAGHQPRGQKWPWSPALSHGVTVVSERTASMCRAVETRPWCVTRGLDTKRAGARESPDLGSDRH